MRVFSESSWRQLGYEMVKTSGLLDSDVETIVDVLVTGSLRGIDSHGVRAFPVFTAKKPPAQCTVIKEMAGTALLDANHTFGPVSAKKAMELALQKAEKTGIGSCSIVNGEWIVNLFYYAMMAVQADMIGVVTAREGPVCAPWGGIKPVGGTNPLSVGIPAGKEYPLVLDFATTMVAQGHVKTFLLEGKPLPEGWLIDTQGNPVKGYDLALDELEVFWESGGALLPFGTYKGYGINLVIDVLGGALNLTGTGRRAQGQGVLMTAINIKAFTTVIEFKKEVDRLIREVKASPVRPGFDEVLLPGEREHRIFVQRQREGIPIDEISWQEIVSQCQDLKIDLKKIMG
jgi:LDH2 family malate/lactate/ureidoglycolate dehydrogenase